MDEQPSKGDSLKFCSQCGETVEHKVPSGDNRLRYICVGCDTVHYQNPNVVVGTIPIYVDQEHGVRVLLCRRNIEPRHGFWTLPAGFLENDETSSEGAHRETIEESCANIDNLSIYRVFNVSHANQIHMFFRANMLNDSFSTTSESSEVRLFSFDEIPWGELAFPTVHKALLDLVDDHIDGQFAMQMIDVEESYWRQMKSPVK